MFKTIHKEIVKFLVVGGISTIINYIVFYTAYSLLSINYIVSSGSGYIAGLLFGYALNRNWTFSDNKATKKTNELVLYFIVYTVSLVVSLLFLKLLVVIFNFNPLVANVFAIGLSTVTNFIGLKFIVFKKNE